MTAQREVTEIADPADGGGHRARTRAQDWRRWLSGFAVVGVAAVLWLLVYAGPAGNISADTLQYAYQTRLMMGDDSAKAYTTAVNWYCARPDAATSSGHVSRADCLREMAAPGAAPYRTPRFQAIFHSRPGWPLLAAPLVAVFAMNGLVVLAFLGGLAAGAACYWAVRELGGGHRAGLASMVGLYLLPSGYWLTNVLPEGLILALSATAAIGAIRLVNGRPWGATLFAAALAMTFATKSANAVAITVFVSVAAAGLFLFSPGRTRKRLAVLVAIAAAVTVAWLAFSRLMHYAGVHETLEDLATWHFTRPAHGDPWQLLWDRDVTFGLPFLRQIVTDPWWLILLGLATWKLARRSVSAASIWLAVGASAVMICLAHPIVSNWPRLLIPIWLPVAIGLALFVGGPRRPQPQDSPQQIPRPRSST